MKKRFKKFMALAMTGALLCSSMTAFAAVSGDATTSPASGNASGNGKVEGWVEKDVFCVNLPTTPLSNDIYSFVLDPQDLIHKSVSGNSTQFTKEQVSGNGLYFTNYASGSATGMSGSSDSLTATNKGTTDVDIALTATVSNLASGEANKIKLASSDALGSGDGTSIYLAIAVSGDAKNASGNAITSPVAITGTNATGQIKGSLGKASADAYEITYVSGNASGNGYKYQLTASAEAEGYTGFKKVTFNLVGKCNQDASVDWSKLKDVKPSVNVTWVLTKHVNGYASSTTISASSNTVTLNTPDGVSLTNLVIDYADSRPDYILYGTSFASATRITNGGVVTFSTAVTDEHGSSLILSYSDGHTDTITIQ